MEWEEIAAMIGNGLASIATASRDGRPHAAVVSPAISGRDLIFGTRASSGKACNIAENPQVALMWRPQAEIYVHGSATVISDPGEKRRLWQSGLLPFDPASFWGTPDNPDFVFVRVEPDSAIVLSAGPEGLLRRTWAKAEKR